MFRSISNASNDSPQPPMARQGSTTSRPQAARFSVYLSEPFSSQSLASTLVDYNDYVHATGTEVLVNHRHVEDVSKNKFQRGNVDTPVPKQWHVWLLRINVFLVSFSTHGYAISFGQQVVQRHDHWSKHPASALVMIGALQICMFYATVPAARIAQGQKWWEVLLLLSGVAAGSLICTAPKLNVLPAIVVLQGVCLGLSLAMMHNMVLLKVLQMKYDYHSNICFYGRTLWRSSHASIGFCSWIFGCRSSILDDRRFDHGSCNKHGLHSGLLRQEHGLFSAMPQSCKGQRSSRLSEPKTVSRNRRHDPRIPWALHHASTPAKLGILQF